VSRDALVPSDPTACRRAVVGVRRGEANTIQCQAAPRRLMRRASQGGCGRWTVYGTGTWQCWLRKHQRLIMASRILSLQHTIPILLCQIDLIQGARRSHNIVSRRLVSLFDAQLVPSYEWERSDVRHVCTLPQELCSICVRCHGSRN
jgi:hypothetical protein